MNKDFIGAQRIKFSVNSKDTMTILTILYRMLMMGMERTIVLLGMSEL